MPDLPACNCLWLTDLHLGRLPGRADRQRFFLRLKEQKEETESSCILISGDIGTSRTFGQYLVEMDMSLSSRIYFVLGNHDFWGDSLESVRRQACQLKETWKNLIWLSDAGVVHLTEHTALVGHDGFADARNGDFEKGHFTADFGHIEELKAAMTFQERKELLQNLGDASAEYFRKHIPEALRSHDHVIVLTHVPPFAEAVFHEGMAAGPGEIPFLSSQAAGETLRSIMSENPGKSMTVLCGHSHSAANLQIMHNLKVIVGEAEYGENRPPITIPVK